MRLEQDKLTVATLDDLLLQQSVARVERHEQTTMDEQRERRHGEQGEEGGNLACILLKSKKCRNSLLRRRPSLHSH